MPSDEAARPGPGGRRARPRPAGAVRAVWNLLASAHIEPAVAVTSIAVALAASGGRPAAGIAAVGSAVMAGQLSVGWHNDWLDAERDRATGRTDKPVAAGAVPRGRVGVAAGIALAAVVPLSLLSGPRAGLCHIAAVAAAWAYNARLKATVWSFAPYAVAFPLLVAFVSLGRHGHPWPPWWALITAALLGSGAHLANAAPDVTADLAGGIRGLPQRLGADRSVVGAVALLLAATAAVTFGPGHPSGAGLLALSGALVAVVGAVATRGRLGSRMLFRAAMVVALIDAASLVARGVGT